MESAFSKLCNACSYSKFSYRHTPWRRCARTLLESACVQSYRRWCQKVAFSRPAQLDKLDSTPHLDDAAAQFGLNQSIENCLLAVSVVHKSPWKDTEQGYREHRNCSAHDRGCASKRIRTCRIKCEAIIAARIEIVWVLFESLVYEQLLRISEERLHVHPCSEPQAAAAPVTCFLFDPASSSACCPPPRPPHPSRTVATAVGNVLQSEEAAARDGQDVGRRELGWHYFLIKTPPKNAITCQMHVCVHIYVCVCIR